MARRVVTTCCFLLPLAYLFGPALFGQQSVAFRDAGHFYYPLFWWIRQAWGDGLPLWNPQEYLGASVIGDATSSVFYPGKILFALPLPYPTAFNLYIALHVLLAECSMYWFCLRRGCSWSAATLAAVSFALGGAVLSQTCNPVFLVGAAWLPLAWLKLEESLNRRCLLSASFAAMSLAMTILGGDPQLAYIVLVCGAGYAFVAWRHERGKRQSAPRWSQRRPTLLFLTAVCAGLLSAIQVLPSLETSGHSVRRFSDKPASIWGVMAGKWDSWEEVTSGIFHHPDLDTHAGQRYEFSVAPWRTLELVWPNVGGRFMPENRRWMSALPASDRVWSGTYYMGLLPILLAAAVWYRRRDSLQVRGLTWLATFSLIASLGWFGLGWIVQEAVQAAGGQRPTMGGPVGGLYWLMVTVLPGFGSFRYPAKFFVVASFAFSALAAHGWDQLLCSDAGLRVRRRLQSMTVLVLGLSVVSAGVLLATRSAWTAWLEESTTDVFFGPLSVSGAAYDVFTSLFQCALLCVAVLVLIGYIKRRPTSSWLPNAVVVLVSCEILVANHWLVPLVNQADLVPVVKRQPLNTPSDTIATIYRGPHSDYPWQDSSPDRIQQGTRWETETLFPRHHLRVPGLRNLTSSSSLIPRDMSAVLAFVQGDPERNRLLRTLGLQFIVEPAGMLTSVSNALPPAWTAEQLEVRSPLQSDLGPNELGQETHDLLSDLSRFDSARGAIVEAPAPLPLVDLSKMADDESCRLVRPSAHHIELKTKFNSQRFVVINEQFDKNWKALLVREDGEKRLTVYRTNRVTRGVVVPAGVSKIVMRYRPTRFYLGAILSMLAAMSWIIAVSRIRRRRRRED